MDPVIALYTVLLATVLGLSGFARSDTRRRGRGLLLASVLAGFIVVAAVSALVTATTIPGMIVTALAVLFSAQAATTALALLWREIRTETRPRGAVSKAGTENRP
jgi:ABC-type transport system involved in cytochrome c biogenesis permease component